MNEKSASVTSIIILRETLCKFLFLMKKGKEIKAKEIKKYFELQMFIIRDSYVKAHAPGTLISIVFIFILLKEIMVGIIINIMKTT